MNRTYAYIQLSSLWEDADSQRHQIQAYSQQRGIQLAGYIEAPHAARRRSRRQRIKELCASLALGDCLVVAALSKLGRSTGEVIVLLDQLMNHGVTVIAIQEGLTLQHESEDRNVNRTGAGMVTLLARLAEIEQDFVSSRAKEALSTKKAQGMVLGKPKGTLQASMYDKDREQIEELLRLGVSQRRIVTLHLGYGTPNSLNHYIRTRGLTGLSDAKPHGFHQSHRQLPRELPKRRKGIGSDSGTSRRSSGR